MDRNLEKKSDRWTYFDFFFPFDLRFIFIYMLIAEHLAFNNLDTCSYKSNGQDLHSISKMAHNEWMELVRSKILINQWHLDIKWNERNKSY